MSRCTAMTEVSRSAAHQAEYCRLSALVQLRLEALQRALDEHERAGRWSEHEHLKRVEAVLAELLAEVLRS